MVVINVTKKDSPLSWEEYLLNKKYGKVFPVCSISFDNLFFCEKQGEKTDEIEIVKTIDNFDIVKFINIMNTKLPNWNYYFLDTEIEFNMYSPAGRDFSFAVSYRNGIDGIIDNIYEYFKSFDCSYETYIWLDHSGHGINGAPYDMKNIYIDSEAIEDAILNLYNVINSELR